MLFAFVVFIDFSSGWFGVFGLAYGRTLGGLSVLGGLLFFAGLIGFILGWFWLLIFELMTRWCYVVCDFVSFAFVLLFGL